MNIYFACSITGGRELEPVYREIVAALAGDGHDIPTSHLALAETMEKERLLSPRDIYERDVNWIDNCGTLIAEVSVPSHGVGYEVGYALGVGKPVLCLHQRGRAVSKMISGNPKLTVQAYEDTTDAISRARRFLEGM